MGEGHIGDLPKGEFFPVYYANCGLCGIEEPFEAENSVLAKAEARRKGWVQSGPRRFGWVHPGCAAALRAQGRL